MPDNADAVVGELNQASGGGLGLPAPVEPRRQRGAGARNHDWWPNQLSLEILR